LCSVFPWDHPFSPNVLPPFRLGVKSAPSLLFSPSPPLHHFCLFLPNPNLCFFGYVLVVGPQCPPMRFRPASPCVFAPFCKIFSCRLFGAGQSSWAPISHGLFKCEFLRTPVSHLFPPQFRNSFFWGGAFFSYPLQGKARVVHFFFLFWGDTALFFFPTPHYHKFHCPCTPKRGVSVCFPLFFCWMLFAFFSSLFGTRSGGPNPPPPNLISFLARPSYFVGKVSPSSRWTRVFFPLSVLFSRLVEAWLSSCPCLEGHVLCPFFSPPSIEEIWVFSGP